MSTLGGEFSLVSTSAKPGDTSLGDYMRQLAPLSCSLKWYASGREALTIALGTAAKTGCDTLVLPAYVCESVLSASHRYDWRVVLVDTDESGLPNAEALAAAAELAGNRACFLALPLFGRAYPTNILTLLEEARGAGAFVVWDLTHGLFSNWAHGRYLWFASLRKWCGIPDGGVLATAEADVEECQQLEPDDEFFTLRLKAMGQKREYERGECSEETFVDLLALAEARLDHDSRIRCMSALSRDLINHVDVENLKRRRRANARRFLEVVDRRLVTPLCDFDEDDVPFGVPVRLKNRDRVRQGLRERRIFCPVHWPLPSEVRHGRYPGAQKLSASCLTIPCDERLTPADMERISDLLTSLMT